MFEGNSGTAPGIARGFRLGSWLLAGVGGGRRWRASVAGIGGGRPGGVAQKTPVSLIKTTKTRHCSKQRKQRTTHTELLRVINHQKCAYTPRRLQVAREPGRRRRRQRNMTNEGMLDGGDMPTGTRTGPQIGSLARKKRRQRFFPFAGKAENTSQPDAWGAAPDHQDGGCVLGQFSNFASNRTRYLFLFHNAP